VIKMYLETVGSFKIESERIIVSDPCYDVKTCAHVQYQLDALNGTWDASVWECKKGFKLVVFAFRRDDSDKDKAAWIGSQAVK
jgi:hypothetical protein